MPLPKRRKVLFGSLLAGLVLLAVISIYALTRTQRDIPRPETVQAETTTEGFSFFGIHRETILSRRLRERLADQLGRDAITHRGPIDLIVIDPAFTQTHLPEIHRFHMALNPAFGGRREHAVTQLTYRRANQQGVPFRFVRLLFSQDTGNPLYLIVAPVDDDPGIFETLQAKYGTPATVKGERAGDQVLVWNKPDEILAGVSIRRRGGRIDRQLRFYFLANIRYLIEQENATAEAQRSQSDKAERRAF